GSGNADRFIVTAKNHAAGGGLQHARHRDVQAAADAAARVVDDDHRAVVQIRDTLVVFLAFFCHEHGHDLAGEHDRLQRVGQLVDVEDFDTAKLRDFIEVE